MFLSRQRYAFALFYLGEKYQGYQKQLNGQAIENYIEFALINSEYIHSFRRNNYAASSRTDAGVNALSNIFAINVSKTPNLEEINNNLPKDGSILVWKYAKVSENFNPRDNSYKIYEYNFYNPSKEDITRIKRISEFKGFHNFANFMKKDGAGDKDPYSKILAVEFHENGKNLTLRLKGTNFVREQIRKMIGFVLNPSYDNLELTKLLTDEPNDLQIKPADAAFLTLTDVKFDGKLNWIAHEKSIRNKFVRVQDLETKNFATVSTKIQLLLKLQELSSNNAI